MNVSPNGERIPFRPESLNDLLDAINARGDYGRVAVSLPSAPAAPTEAILAALRRSTTATVTLFDESAPVYNFDIAVEVTPTGVYSWHARVILNRFGAIGVRGLFVIDREGWSPP